MDAFEDGIDWPEIGKAVAQGLRAIDDHLQLRQRATNFARRLRNLADAIEVSDSDALRDGHF